ncbi:MAG TPA: primosomal protein N' [Steroidobacteraceae bacterium]|nr:primosomal protein N' [Steroidobacteraceae bacterium]
MILKVALDTPLRRVFDYLPPAAGGEITAARQISPGLRVRVPFGRRQAVGIIVQTVRDSSIAPAKLKRAHEILDERAVFDPVTFDLLRWAADYYHHPLGEVLAAALPASLRAGEAAQPRAAQRWTLTAAGRRQLETPAGRRAPRRQALLAHLAAAGSLESGADIGRAQLQSLAARGWALAEEVPARGAPLEFRPSDVTLTDAQTAAIGVITASLQRFGVHLLHGVTGSGKTEVYLQAIRAALERAAGGAGGEGQVLVLVPEIALTPQLVERFALRFSTGVVVLHSALAPAQRRDAWRAAHGGQARIVIGTRSAVFTSMKRLRLIVVDEEHDPSYKQQEGFRYSARDLAVSRAQRADVPVILGSATPSLETLENVAQGRYHELKLPHRPGAAQAPRMHLIDLRRFPSEQGLSQPAMQAISRHLADGGQVIVFLNRRGYAPCLFCCACGWVAQCAHCDARMTLHRRAGQLRCHHCGARAEVPALCGHCRQSVHAVGQGTERVEETLERLFPQAPLARLDRDTAGAQRAMHTVLDRVRRGEARILVGTQMLTKGHHFPDVSLVVILDADQGLFAGDFRATERLAQTITQVAGRAGRAARAGEVVIQTSFPEHPLLRRLIGAGYEGFAASALEERRAARWPPYSRLALLRAEARDETRLDAFLKAAAAGARPIAAGVTVLGPAAAVIARRADHFRAHLLIESAARAPLQRFLDRWLPLVETLPGPAGLRWSIDVDPLEVD